MLFEVVTSSVGSTSALSEIVIRWYICHTVVKISNVKEEKRKDKQNDHEREIKNENVFLNGSVEYSKATRRWRQRDIKSKNNFHSVVLCEAISQKGFCFHFYVSYI